MGTATRKTTTKAPEKTPAKAAPAKAPGTEVAKTASAVPATGAAANIPAFMKQDAGRGTENLGSGDYEMPRIKLMQGLSDELQAFDNLKAGDFFHTLSEDNLGQELEIIPLYISKRYVLWRPRHDGGGILARADDAVHWSPPTGEFEVRPIKDVDRKVKWKLAPTVAKSGLDAWGSYDPTNPNSQPAATLAYVMVVWLPQHPEISPVALLLQRTAIGPARKLMGKLKISQAPIYGMQFTMNSFLDDRNGQKFNNYRFTANGFVTDEELYNTCKQLHSQFKEKGVNVKDLENAQDEGGDVGKEDVADNKTY